MRVAQPVQLRAFRDYLVRQCGYTTGGFSATLASEKLAKVSKLSTYEIEDMFEYVYCRVLLLHFLNQSVRTQGQMETRWPIRCHVAH
jgi:aerobic-type carbon monoxide dehydrogenase small subunit (CoxS/CutS family)